MFNNNKMERYINVKHLKGDLNFHLKKKDTVNSRITRLLYSLIQVFNGSLNIHIQNN